MYTNWSGQYESTPSVCVAPASVDELKELIKDKVRHPSPVVAVGSTHSNSGCTVLKSGTALSLENFRQFKSLESDSITVGAGLQLIEVHRYLAGRNLQVPFTPEIGNATIGSVACCCLKDAGLGASTGFAVSMVESVRFVDAQGEDRFMDRRDSEWANMTSSHGLFGIIYEVTLDVHPMHVVTVGLVLSHVANSNWPQLFSTTTKNNDGIFGFFDATSGRFIFETRNLNGRPGKPSFVERRILKINKWMFKYFNPILGISERHSWSRFVRWATAMFLRIRSVFYPRGMRVYKNLKPIDYSAPYRFRWDFHFWAFPIKDYPASVIPAFRRFYADFCRQHPAFDEKGFLACYRVRQDTTTLLSPSFDGDVMTLDPVRPMSKSSSVMELWDKFLTEFNDFAVEQGGRCTFNQTKHLTQVQVEKAFGDRWKTFKEARRRFDPDTRFLSSYFARLLGEEVGTGAE